MAKMKINSTQYETNGARTILDVTRAHGIEVPTFCYNPELSIAANCRMCLVEVKGSPKLLPACQTDVRDGMEVLTDSPRVKAWQQQNLEYILLHHPVDCPICDQAGECDLQEHYQRYDRQRTRLWSWKDKRTKPKRVVLGPHIVYDAERCILCTQCIRFCEEIWGERLLDSHLRGDHRFIIVARGETLDFPYSLMVAEVCPVGAMTSRDFRFAKRVWMLHPGETICPGCATGCAAYADSHEGRIYRLRPRRDDGVNRAWLCDEGVLSCRLHNEGRVAGPAVGREPAGIEAALDAAAKILSGLSGAAAAVLSAERSTEDNLALAAFAREALGTSRFYLAARPDGEADRLLRSADRNPNRRGATAAAGGAIRPAADLAGAADLRAVIALEGIGPESLPVGVRAVVIASRRGDLERQAEVVLPAPSFAQARGSYINAKGMRRSFGVAIGHGIHETPPPPVSETLDRLAAAMGLAHRTGDVEASAARIAAEASPKAKEG